MIKTTHIQSMLNEALVLARDVEASTKIDGTGQTIVTMLERAENLCAHAAQELRDEMLVYRDGWKRL